MLKKFLFALLAIVAFALIAAIFVDGKMHYEKSVTIKAPIEKVSAYTTSLKGMDQWSPWNDRDPKMKKTWTGTDGTPGASQCWESANDEVGKGCQTIKSVQPNGNMETTIKFYEPYESEAAAYIKLAPNGAETVATWGFDSEVPYPWRLGNLFMNMEKMIGADYEKGLARLKQLSEQ